MAVATPTAAAAAFTETANTALYGMARDKIHIEK